MISDAVAVVRALGVAVESWRVLSRSNRLVLELKPCDLIAKVVPVEDLQRLVSELAVAAHVVARGGPVAKPARVAKPGAHRSETVAVSLWERLELLGAEATAADARRAYLELRDSLDSFSDTLPDFRAAILRAKGLARERLQGLSREDATFVEAVLVSGLSNLSAFRWSNTVLHGDAHSGNVVLTPEGPRWLDLESACVGPIEWDLCSRSECADVIVHDRELLADLKRLRNACVVAWCAAKAEPNAEEQEAIAHHLAALRR